MTDHGAEPRVVDLNFQGYEHVIASYLLSGAGEVGLIESGPTTTLPILLEALEPFGGPSALNVVALTHIHLDHAGAVGKLLQLAPNAVCYVHSKGVQHIVDPSRLLRSASRIYGEDMERLWGEVVPAPENRVVAVDDGDIISVGGRELQVLYTPGHASHHTALYDESLKAAYTGDVAGVRLPSFQHVRTPTPPPDIDLELWAGSIERLRQLDLHTLYMTHFGPHSTGIEKQFDDALARLELWTRIVREGLARGDDSSTISSRLQEESDGELQDEGASDADVREYALASPYGMSVDGLVRFVKTHASVTTGA